MRRTVQCLPGKIGLRARTAPPGADRRCLVDPGAADIAHRRRSRKDSRSSAPVPRGWHRHRRRAPDRRCRPAAPRTGYAWRAQAHPGRHSVSSKRIVPADPVASTDQPSLCSRLAIRPALYPRPKMKRAKARNHSYRLICAAPPLEAGAACACRGRRLVTGHGHTEHAGPRYAPVIRREDYRPPDWLVPHVSLAFDLGAAETRVVARAHPDAQRRARSGRSVSMAMAWF